MAVFTVSVNNFLAKMIARFCCYDYGANASEVVEKITKIIKIITNASCVCSLLQHNSQRISSITNSKERLVTGTPPTYQKNCRSCTK